MSFSPQKCLRLWSLFLVQPYKSLMHVSVPRYFLPVPKAVSATSHTFGHESNKRPKCPVATFSAQLTSTIFHCFFAFIISLYCISQSTLFPCPCIMTSVTELGDEVLTVLIFTWYGNGWLYLEQIFRHSVFKCYSVDLWVWSFIKDPESNQFGLSIVPLVSIYKSETIDHILLFIHSGISVSVRVVYTL